MFADLIEKIKRDPEWGANAKERAQKILEHSEIFSYQEGVKGIVKGPGWPLIPVSDLYGLVSYLVDALAFLNPDTVAVHHSLDLWAKHIRICQELRELFNDMQQRGMISGKEGLWDWPKNIGKIYKSVDNPYLHKIIDYPAKADPKAAKKHLIKAFLKYSPNAPNGLIADKILILLRDIVALPEADLPSHSRLRQDAGDLRKKAELQSKILTFPKSKAT